MKIAYVSDLHIDHQKTEVILPIQDYISLETDVLVIAGDVCNNSVNTELFLRKHLDMIKALGAESILHVLFVPGNHEYYIHPMEESDLNFLSIERDYMNFRYLDSSRPCQIGGVLFIGDTMWTDMLLNGRGALEDSICAANYGMNDFRSIWIDKYNGRKFTAEISTTMFSNAVNMMQTCIENMKAYDSSTKIVVITHHLPSFQSVHDMYRTPRFSALNPAFASGLLDNWHFSYNRVLAENVDVWIHGHTHNSFDYIINNRTQVVCNPCGYGWENAAAFDKIKFVHV